MARAGLRSPRERSNSLFICRRSRSRAWEGFVEGQVFSPAQIENREESGGLLPSTFISSEAQVCASGSCATTNNTVGVRSTARSKRNHEANGMRRASLRGTSPRSIATTPNPPLCSSRSVARNACSTGPSLLLASLSFLCLCGEFAVPHRTHSNRLKSIPAAAADKGSSASLTSTSAHASLRRVAAASVASNMLVRPEEAGPQISVMHPRGRPPESSSISGMPLETISGAGRTSRREAGEIPANFGIADRGSKPTGVFFGGKTKPVVSGETGTGVNCAQMAGDGMEFQKRKSRDLKYSFFIRLKYFPCGRRFCQAVPARASKEPKFFPCTNRLGMFQSN